MERYSAVWFEQLKSRHPFPGGWRQHAKSTELEDAFAAVPATPPKRYEGELPYFMLDRVDLTGNSRSALTYKPYMLWRGVAVIVHQGCVYATIGWIVRNLTEGWSLNATRKALARHPDVRRKRHDRSLYHYRVADVIRTVGVTRKTHGRPRIAPSVARVLQGAGSIDEKLLAFVRDGAE